MVVLATGHPVRCILWVQVAIFNKGIGFLCGSKFVALNKFVKNIFNQVSVWCCKYAKKLTVKDVPTKNYELLNIQACSPDLFWNSGHTQSRVVNCGYWVVPLMSTRDSGYSHVILLVFLAVFVVVDEPLACTVVQEYCFHWQLISVNNLLTLLTLYSVFYIPRTYTLDPVVIRPDSRYLREQCG